MGNARFLCIEKVLIEVIEPYSFHKSGLEFYDELLFHNLIISYAI